MAQLLILNYHNILPDESARSNHGPFDLTRSAFLDQLNLIARLELPVISITQWLSGETKAQLAIALTFDDGYKSHANIVAPELKSRQFPATFFPSVTLIGQPGFLLWDDLRKIQESQFEIQSHGLHHVHFTRLSDQNLRRELAQSKEHLEHALGRPIRQLALPFGAYTNGTLSLAKEYYQTILTTRSLINMDPRALILHRFNTKSSTTIDTLTKLLQRQPDTLRHRRLSSAGAHFVHRLTSLVVRMRRMP